MSRWDVMLNALAARLIGYSCRHLVGQDRAERELECRREFEHIRDRSDINCKLHKTVFALLYAEDLARGNRLLPYDDSPEGAPLVPVDRMNGFAVVARYCWDHLASAINLSARRVRASLIVGVLACVGVSVLSGILVGILASNAIVALVVASAALATLLTACRLTTEQALGAKHPVSPSSTAR